MLDEQRAAAHQRVLRGVSAHREKAEAQLAAHLRAGAQRSTIVRQERLVSELRNAEQLHRGIVARLRTAAT